MHYLKPTAFAIRKTTYGTLIMFVELVKLVSDAAKRCFER